MMCVMTMAPAIPRMTKKTPRPRKINPAAFRVMSIDAAMMMQRIPTPVDLLLQCALSALHGSPIGVDSELYNWSNCLRGGSFDSRTGRAGGGSEGPSQFSVFQFPSDEPFPPVSSSRKRSSQMRNTRFESPNYFAGNERLSD